MGNDWIVCALFALAEYVAKCGDRDVSVPHYGTFKASDLHARAEADRNDALDAAIAEPAPAPRDEGPRDALCHFCLGSGLAQNVAPGVLQDQPCRLCGPRCARHPEAPLRRFGDLWRCSECGEVADLLATPTLPRAPEPESAPACGHCGGSGWVRGFFDGTPEQSSRCCGECEAGSRRRRGE